MKYVLFVILIIISFSCRKQNDFLTGKEANSTIIVCSCNNDLDGLVITSDNETSSIEIGYQKIIGDKN